MDSDVSWYENAQNDFKNQPSTSGTQPGRPPDEEMKEEKPDTKNIIPEVCLVDEEDDAEEAVNSFHNWTRKTILLPFTGVEIQEESKFLEAIKQFRRILEKKVEVLTLRRNLKEMLYKYLHFFGTTYGRIAILYKDQYLDVMEDILVLYCDVIKEFFKEKKRTKIIQEARRIKILLRDCLWRKMDRILHVLLKVRLAPEITGCGLLWGDVYMYFLTKVPCKYSDDDILRGFIAFQRFKTIRANAESSIIDKLMLGIYKKTMGELRRIPCLGEIMDKMKNNTLYTIRDMVKEYTRYYEEKRNRTEPFGTDECDVDTDDANINEMRRLDLSDSDFPCIPSTSRVESRSNVLFSDRKRSNRKTVLDLAAESNIDQYSNVIKIFGDDVAKQETPDDPIVVLLDDDDDDEDEDDVIVVCDNLKNVITIDDDEESPVTIPPARSPPPREALSPDKMVPLPEELQSTSSTAEPSENHPQNDAPPPDLMEVDNLLPPESSTNAENSVPDTISSPKEPIRPENTPLPSEKSDVSIPKEVRSCDIQKSTRRVTEVGDSLKITIQTPPSRVSTPNIRPLVQANRDGQSGERGRSLALPEKSLNSSEAPSDSGASRKDISETQSPMPERSAPEKVFQPGEVARLFPHETTPVFHEQMEISSRQKQNISDLNVEKRLPTNSQVSSPETASVVRLNADKNELPSDDGMDTEPEKETPSVRPIQMPEAATEQPNLSEPSPSERPSSDKSDRSSESISRIDGNDKNTTELGTSSSGDTSDGAVNSMNEETVPVKITTSISPVVKENINCVTETPILSTTKRIGVVPFSKTPTDLKDLPNPGPDSNTNASPRDASVTSEKSSPSTEGIDETRAEVDSGTPSSSNSKTETSIADTSGDSTKTALCETTVQETTKSLSSTYTATCANSEPILNSPTVHRVSGASALEEPSAGILKHTVIRVEHAENSNDVPDEAMIKPDEGTAVQKTHGSPGESSLDKPTLQTETESRDLDQEASRSPNEPRNYSNLTECFTKFGEELSVEDIFTSQTEDLVSSTENLALSTIDLVPSTEKANKDVIVVKCRTMEPLKAEESTAPGSETVVFSANDILAPSNETIALLVTYPDSPEEDGHFLMCDADLAPSDERLAFPGDETSPVCDSAGDHDEALLSTESTTVLHPRIDGRLASSSGTPPYSPRSSPSPRMATAKPDINSLVTGAGVLEPRSDYAELPGDRPSNSPKRESIITEENRSTNDKISLDTTSEETEKVTKTVNLATQRSPEHSSTTVKSRRISSDLSEDETLGIAKRDDTTVPSPEYAVEDFREDLSQTITSAKRVTPQEVDKITQLPFKYSQQLWSDRSPQTAETSPFGKQFRVDGPVSAKLPQQPQKTGALRPSPRDSSQTPTLRHNISLPRDTPKVLQPDTTSIGLSDRPIKDSTCSTSFVEEKLDELYLKEYGNGLPRADDPFSRPKSKRRKSREGSSPGRSVNIYPGVSPVKHSSQPKDSDISQPKDRDMSLKSYKALIKGVSKRKAGVLRDLDFPPQKEEGISQLYTKKTDVSRRKSFNDTYRQEVYENHELFDNGMEGPVGKPTGGADLGDNFLWDSEPDTTKEDGTNGTISVKPDSHLYQVNEGSTTKSSVSSSTKNSKSRADDGSSVRKNPEKVTFESGLYDGKEASTVQEKLPNYFDYSFNNIFASQNNFNVPIPQNIISPAISASYYPYLNYFNRNSAQFDNDKLPNQNNLFLPPQNLEIDPNLLHSEKNALENFVDTRSSEDVGGVPDQRYGSENAENSPYLALSEAFVGGTGYSFDGQRSGVMFKDNPFIGPYQGDVSLAPSRMEINSYLETEQTAALALSGMKASALPTAAEPAVPADDYAFMTRNNEHVASNTPRIQPPVPMYGDSTLNSQNNLYCDPNSLPLPDISTLKDPRRKIYGNFPRGGPEMDGSDTSPSNNNANFMTNIEMMPPSGSASGAQTTSVEFPAADTRISRTPGMSESLDSVPVRPNVEDSLRIPTSDRLRGETVRTTATPTAVLLPPEIGPGDNDMLEALSKMEESNASEAPQKTQLPPKKRKLTEDEQLAIYIQKIEEEKKAYQTKVEENISYPAQRQMSIADLQRDFARVKTPAARKLYPEGNGYPDQSYYEYPQGYDQYADFNDYGNNKRSIMNVYINGVRECSANYPLCLMIGTVHTCVNDRSNNAAENDQQPENAGQPRPHVDVPRRAEPAMPAQNLQNVQKPVVPELAVRPVAEVPPARPKRSRKAGACGVEAPPAKRGRGRPRKIVN